MPSGRPSNSRRRRSHRQNRELILIGIVTLVTLAVVFALLYALTSFRFLKGTGD